jgi:hypothetical protein
LAQAALGQAGQGICLITIQNFFRQAQLGNQGKKPKTENGI